MSSITLLTIQHQGMKSALRLQKSMTTCPLPSAFLWQTLKKPLLELSMAFFNSQLCFHLKRQAKTNYSSLRSTMGISSLPTSIIIRQECFSIPSYAENMACLLGQAGILLLCLHSWHVRLQVGWAQQNPSFASLHQGEPFHSCRWAWPATRSHRWRPVAGVVWAAVKLFSAQRMALTISDHFFRV